MKNIRICIKCFDTTSELDWRSCSIEFAFWIMLGLFFLGFSVGETKAATTSENDIVEVQADGIADSSGVYSYCPSILKMDGNYMTWWLAASSWGDSIGYKVTQSPSTMINYGYTTVLHGAQTGLSQAQGGMWDDQSDGDPSVLKIGGVYYLYYDGNNWDDPATQQGGISVAMSYDNGATFTKLFNGQPLIQETHDASAWGDGAPQVAVGPDGYYYMIYVHDLTAATESYRVIKSTDPTFSTYTLVTDIPWATFSPTGFRRPAGAGHSLHAHARHKLFGRDPGIGRRRSGHFRHCVCPGHFGPNPGNRPVQHHPGRDWHRSRNRRFPQPGHRRKHSPSSRQ
jgi:hypothetical protein